MSSMKKDLFFKKIDALGLAVTYDDVRLKTGYSTVMPHAVFLETRFSRHITLQAPLVSAAMDTVTESKMAIAIAEAGGLGIIHRGLSPEAQAREVRKVKSKHLTVGAAIGAGEYEIKRAALLIHAGCDVIVLDTAHGDSQNVYGTLRTLKKQYPKTDIVVGNITEGESAGRLARAGADGIKVGQGPGAICTTRIVAGIGCPQVTAVYNCAKALRGSGIPVCADGGIRNLGDVTIAIAAGAHSVMLGRVLAGTREAPGAITTTKQGKMKVYRGMGSLAAMKASRASRERYRQDEMSVEKLIPEGVEGIVPYQGDVAPILERYIGGLRLGMGYVGAKDIRELQEKANFYRISNAGLAESHSHDITITDLT